MFKLWGLACGPDNFRKNFFLGFFAGLLISSYYSVFSFCKLLILPDSITTQHLIQFIVSYIIGVFCFISLHPAIEMWYINRLSLNEVNGLIKELKRKNIIDRVKSLSFSKEREMSLEIIDINDFKLFSNTCFFCIFLQALVFPAVFLFFTVYGMLGFSSPIYLVLALVYFIAYHILKFLTGRLLHDLIDEEKESLFWQIKAEFYIDFFNNKDFE